MKTKGLYLLFFVLFAIICLLEIWRVGILASQKYQKTRRYQQPPSDNMVFVPPGQFLMGSNASESELDERPLRLVFVQGFYIDKFEVTNDEYSRFDPNHLYPGQAGSQPATGILRADATAYCQCFDKRLPTGVEWEKAARGTDGRIYPWGNQLKNGVANIRRLPVNYSSLLPVGSFPDGISPFGCYDMSGNAWEWVSDSIITRKFGSFRADYIRGVIRGGGFNYSPFQARTSYQGFEDPNLTCNDVGFRCAMDALIEK